MMRIKINNFNFNYIKFPSSASTNIFPGLQMFKMSKYFIFRLAVKMAELDLINLRGPAGSL